MLFEPGSALMVDRGPRGAGVEAGFRHRIVRDRNGVGPTRRKNRRDVHRAGEFPSLPKLPSEDDWEQVTLDNLRAWDWAAENPALLRQQKLDVALTTYSLADKKVFRKNVKAAVERGLSEEDTLAALTTIPAKLAAWRSNSARLSRARLPTLTIVDGGGYFDPGKHACAKYGWTAATITLSPRRKKRRRTICRQREGSEAKAEKEKKDTELKELQNKRVARSPMEGRG